MSATYKKWTEESPVTDEDLLSHWGGLIRHISLAIRLSYKMRDEDREDVESEAKIKLLKLPQAKRPFEGYCKTLINNSVRTSIKTLMSRGGGGIDDWRDHRTIDFFQATAHISGDGEDIGDADRVIPTPPSPESAWVNSLTLDAALDCLTDKEREVVQMYYREGLTYETAAERLGVTKTTVANRLKFAYRKLWRRLGVC